jgi:Predicted RNA-binding protein (contains KH domain)
MKLVELTEYLVKNLVKDPAGVIVTMSEEEETIINVKVAEEDIGVVIGKGGKVANSIRTIVQAAAYTTDQGRVRVNIDTDSEK